ncbi:hypothetical protein [Streptomyces caeruleatus]|uniref:Secreted protein n=1 Tax=Streptomyces caeruleatus TaxID=661399 RepID=A0A101U4X3_9ACTN|nr:hypothetical protein [Streptomyces caeruleatus]KUO04134.1 hypothetical protein AQJ67_12805 [Streptomyces caeruleatus]
MRTRTVVGIALSVGITVVAATTVNYASASSPAPESAPAVQEAAASLPQGGDVGGNGQTGGDELSNHGYGRDDDDRGRVYVNERTYSVEGGECIAVISSPATSFNVRNETDRRIEFFTGITCDNGAAIATIGRGDSSNAIPGTVVFDGTVVPFALVGSFRAVDRKHH